MAKHIILSVISNDKPGVIKSISKAVKQNGGNWLESQLSQLAGKFAGVIKVSVADENLAQMHQALQSLREQGIKIYIEELENQAPSVEARKAHFTAVGPDRPGIVMEISDALANYNINILDLNTQCTSMPYSGEPLFEAQGEVSVPLSTPLEDVYDQLCAIADQLAIDIHLEEGQTTDTE